MATLTKARKSREAYLVKERTKALDKGWNHAATQLADKILALHEAQREDDRLYWMQARIMNV